MLKKLFKWTGILAAVAVWTAVFAFLARLAMSMVWGFDASSPEGWRFLAAWWDNGGQIKSLADYLFVFSIVGLAVVYLGGLKKAMEGGFWKWVSGFFPKEKYEARHIPLKNIESSKKMTLADMVEAKMGRKGGGDSPVSGGGVRAHIRNKAAAGAEKKGGAK